MSLQYTTTFSVSQYFDVFPFHYIVLSVFVLFTLLGGFLLKYQHTKFPGEFLLHQKIYKPLNSKWIPSKIKAFVDLTYGELLFLFGYFATNVAFAVYGVLNARSKEYFRHGVAQYIAPISAAFGQLLLLNFSFILLPISRNSMLTVSIGIAFERALKYHILLGKLCWNLTFVHAIVMIIWCALDSYVTWWYPFSFKWYRFGLVGAGLISFCAYTILTALSLNIVRRKWFEWFYYNHVIFSIIGTILAGLHNYMIAIHASVSLVLYFVDVLIRIIKISTPAKVLALEKVEADTIKLELYKPGFTFTAGQYIFIAITSISWFQYHPFTITCAPRKDNTFTVHIKRVSSGKQWCNRVMQLAEQKPDLSKITVRIEGPYGNPSVIPELYSVLILVAGKLIVGAVKIVGGIGIAPIISIMEDISKNRSQSNEHSWLREQKMYLSWTARDERMFLNFSEILEKLQEDKNVTIWLNSTGKEVKGEKVAKGRPDYNKILKKIKEENPNCKKFGVLSCGPESMVNAIQTAVFEANTCDTKFHFHKEAYVF